MEHYDEDHADNNDTICCTFDRCVFKGDIPESIMTHIIREHHHQTTKNQRKMKKT